MVEFVASDAAEVSTGLAARTSRSGCLNDRLARVGEFESGESDSLSIGNTDAVASSTSFPFPFTRSD
jgi:hypothetical protein